MSWPVSRAPAHLVQLGVDWSYLFFALDDLRTDTGPTSTDAAGHAGWLSRLAYAQFTGCVLPGADDPFFDAIADLSLRVRAATTPALWRRWLEGHYPVAWGSMWESALRGLNRMPSFDEYLLFRPGLGAATTTAVVNEISAQLTVPEHEREHPLIRTVTDVVGVVVCLDDDLYSFPREHWIAEHEGRDPFREPAGIPILMHEHRVGIDDAATILVEIRDRLVLRLSRLTANLHKQQFSPDTITLVDTLIATVPCCLAWAQQCPRYSDPDGKSPGLIELSWAPVHETPPVNQDPLPYPGTASWWG